MTDIIDGDMVIDIITVSVTTLTACSQDGWTSISVTASVFHQSA